MNSVAFILLALILSVVALAVVAFPILAKARTPRLAAVSAQEQLEELLAQQDAAYQALRELNFDHRVGKITDEDFVVFEAGLKHTAANALRALDEFEGEMDSDLDSFIERSVAARRAALSADLRTPDRPGCPTCGRIGSATDKFCASCGAAFPVAEPAPIRATVRTCPHCGQPTAANDRFCAACGKAVVEAAPVGAR